MLSPPPPHPHLCNPVQASVRVVVIEVAESRGTKNNIVWVIKYLAFQHFMAHPTEVPLSKL